MATIDRAVRISEKPSMLARRSRSLAVGAKRTIYSIHSITPFLHSAVSLFSLSSRLGTHYPFLPLRRSSTRP
jgi:hypothetical protein